MIVPLACILKLRCDLMHLFVSKRRKTLDNNVRPFFVVASTVCM